MKKIYSLMLLCAAMVFATGCSKDDDSTPTTVSVSGVTFDKTTLSIEVGKTSTLTAIVAPENATDKNVTWSSDKTNIVTVTDAGVLTAVAVGETTITATSVTDATKKATCTVTVKARLDYIEVNGIKVAVGNLVADGANGAKIGTAIGKGLYFQFGSLIGWSETGDPTITVQPVGYTGNASWNKDWLGDPTTKNVSTGTGDPCKYYLKGTWRLPTKGDLAKLFNNTTIGWDGATGWSWTATSATHTDGLTFIASGWREGENGSLSNVDSKGYCWSSDIINNFGIHLSSSSSKLLPNSMSSQQYGLPVRCVQD